MINWWSEDANFIQPFDLHHLIYISIVAGALIYIISNKKKIREESRKVATVILIISILQQILLYSWYIFETGFDLSESLPLHICRISTLLGIYFLITKDVRMIDIIFYFGLFAYGSFLYPQRIYPVYHVIGISFLINHAMTLLLPYFAYIAFDWRPKLSGMLKAYAIFLGYFAIVSIVNPHIDGNYFYLKYRPFFTNWPDAIYIPAVLVFTFLLFLTAYKFVQFISKVR